MSRRESLKAYLDARMYSHAERVEAHAVGVELPLLREQPEVPAPRIVAPAPPRPQDADTDPANRLCVLCTVRGGEPCARCKELMASPRYRGAAIACLIGRAASSGECTRCRLDRDPMIEVDREDVRICEPCLRRRGRVGARAIATTVYNGELGGVSSGRVR